MAKQTKRQAVEERTRKRPVPSEAEGLAARKEAAKKEAETRRHKREAQVAEVATQKAALKKHEAELVAETRRTLEAEAAAEPQAEQAKPAPAVPQAAKAKKPQTQGADRHTKRPERNVAQTGRAAGPMVTVALRGESAQRLRALAVAQQMSLSKLLVRMMEVFEAQEK